MSIPGQSATAVANAFFSPSKAAAQQVLAQEWARVDAWLERIYSTSSTEVAAAGVPSLSFSDSNQNSDRDVKAAAVAGGGEEEEEDGDDDDDANPSTTAHTKKNITTTPPSFARTFERNEATLHVLQALMSANERAEKEVEVVLGVVEEAASITASAHGITNSRPPPGDISTNPASTTNPSLPPPTIPTAPPSTSTTSLLQTTLHALPPAYQHQLSALSTLISQLGLPVHASVEDVCSLTDPVGAPDMESIAYALVNYDFYSRTKEEGLSIKPATTTTTTTTVSISGNPAADCSFPCPASAPTDPSGTTLPLHFARREGDIRALLRRIKHLIDRDENENELDNRDRDSGDGSGGGNGNGREKGIDLDALHIQTVEMNRQTAVLLGKIDEYAFGLARKKEQQQQQSNVGSIAVSGGTTTPWTDIPERVEELQRRNREARTVEGKV